MNENDKTTLKTAAFGWAIMIGMFYLGYTSGMGHADIKAAKRETEAIRRIKKGLRLNRR